ncbi:CU044_5270 family protein [Streptomyces sp. NBC_01298]|uniref:CU044_5270 family protein n=1 Tax=Streptomyces sp. NBC_01298 TaxID=2903817 RepID=UPI002E121FAE|nr:CU044_5270 family protein [Streptomyces sp. NBC_01298]
MDELFRSMDPSKNGGWQATEAEREFTLVTTMMSPHSNVPSEATVTVTAPRRRWGLGLSAVAAMTVCAFAAVNVLGSNAPQPALAVTPAALHYSTSGKSAKTVLEEVARSAEAGSRESVDGQDLYFKHEMWALSTRIDGVQVTSAIIPEVRETWRKPDGSAKWKAKTKAPVFENDAQRRVWEGSGSAGKTPETWSGTSDPADMSQLRNKPAPIDPAGMTRWLSVNYESFGPGQLFDSISERNLSSLFSPQQRAAVLRVLADTEGIAYRGEATDRAGRPGVSFSVDSDYGGLPVKHTLIFDARNGKLLAYEEELTTSAGSLNVSVPSVILYVNYLEARPQ